jgi:hypothetical protein
MNDAEYAECCCAWAAQCAERFGFALNFFAPHISERKSGKNTSEERKQQYSNYKQMPGRARHDSKSV